MKVRELMEELDQFEAFLHQFETAVNGILGANDSDTVLDALRKKKKAHRSLDVYRLAAVRQYEALRPAIKNYSRCFTSISATEEKQEETYLALIQGGAQSFDQVYDDMKYIKSQLEQLDPEVELDDQGNAVD